jgi:DNA-directed RNA polymerase specialized sigma24 family protein
MNLSQQIAPHLPLLRRFSRALTGDQQVGDAYVAALLELIIADPRVISESGDLKTELYQQYCRVWESVSLNLRTRSERESRDMSTEERLGALSPKAREAFLLMALEGFQQGQIAQMLSLDQTMVSELLAEASRTVPQQAARERVPLRPDISSVPGKTRQTSISLIHH